MLPRCSSLFLMLAISIGGAAATDRKMVGRHKHEAAFDRDCSATGHSSRLRADYHRTRFPRSDGAASASDRSPTRSGLYFDGGGGGLHLRAAVEHLTTTNDIDGRSLFPPKDRFSVDVSVYPEGGQSNGAVIAGVRDVCEESVDDGYSWRIGVHSQSADADRDSRFCLHVRTEMSAAASRLCAAVSLAPNRWSRLTATYDGRRAAFFVNGARVAQTTRQGGALFSDLRSSCKRLVLTAAQEGKLTFRGAVTEFRIWDRALTHSEVASGSRGVVEPLFYDSLIDAANWLSLGGHSVTPRAMQIPGDPSDDFSLSVPKCGQTICDDPAITNSFASNWRLRKAKVVRYRVINVAEDDGSNATITQEQIDLQHAALTAAFREYNVSWTLEVVDVASSSLRHKTIVFGCDSAKIGNGRCDAECRHAVTGDDGGDCAPSAATAADCPTERRGDGRCDVACNRPQFGWDDGDCCLADAAADTTCVDPTSPRRAYMDVAQFKRALNVSNERALSVAFAEWTNRDLIGLSTFPWEKDAFSVYGGVLLQPLRFGHAGHLKNLVHEFGHALGLWHVHHGVSEMPCDDPCREDSPSMLTGDLAEDTRPTPKNMFCGDPRSIKIEKSCANNWDFRETPFNNYMGYADEDCTNSFTPHQVARMHCYLHLKYHSWQAAHEESENEGVVVLAPKIVAATNSSVTMAWLPPMTRAKCVVEDAPTGDEMECLSDGSVIQFAHEASAEEATVFSGYWAPRQATGAPDAEPCEASTKAWLPATPSCDTAADCTLRLTPAVALPAARLSLWVAWNAAGGIALIRVLFADGTAESVRSVPASCDAPFTFMLQSSQPVIAVEVQTTNPFVIVDAIQFHSRPMQTICSHCQPIEYRVYRTPPFESGPFLSTTLRTFTDYGLENNVTYTYSVGAGSDEASPPLAMKVGRAFCGDGLTDGGVEECDDGNRADGDGCSADCRVEPLFHCSGTPSLCYVYRGDGLCEPFEQAESAEDCGHFTPAGFDDQWVVTASHLAQPSCDASEIVGAPRQLSCSSTPPPEQLCQSAAASEVELELTFARPVAPVAVVVHLSSDGSAEPISTRKAIHISLVDNANVSRRLPSSDSVSPSCAQNAVTYPVLLDLTQPRLVIGRVRLRYDPGTLAVAAVRLRSWRLLDTDTLAACRRQRLLYEPTTDQCVRDFCAKSGCSPLGVQHARVNCSGVESGDSCDIRCLDGYRLADRSSVGIRSASEDVTAVCFDGRWFPAAPACSPVDCGRPNIARARVDCPSGTTLGEKCRFACVQPAVLRGARFDSEVTCSSNAVWTVPEAYCQLTCPPPKRSVRQSKTYAGQCRTKYERLSSSTLTANFPIGSSCKFLCLPGYRVTGSGSDRAFEKTCGKRGTWEGGECVPVLCSQPDMVYFGMYNCSRGFRVDSQCQFTCPQPSELRHTRCLPNGTWSQARPCALPQGVCNRPARSRDIHVDCSEKAAIGSACKVRCKAFGYEPVLEHSVTAEGGYRMQLLQRVPRVTCTARKVWKPSVHALACVKKCAREFLGDGWCDFQNNRAYCGWDGGDCCSSTARGGRVRHMFPSLCTSQLCRCLDPYAIENRNDMEHAKWTAVANGTAAAAAILQRVYGGDGEQRPIAAGRQRRAHPGTWLNETLADEGSVFELNAVSKYYRRSRGRVGPLLRRRVHASVIRALRHQYKRLQVKS